MWVYHKDPKCQSWMFWSDCHSGQNIVDIEICQMSSQWKNFHFLLWRTNNADELGNLSLKVGKKDEFFISGGVMHCFFLRKTWADIKFARNWQNCQVAQFFWRNFAIMGDGHCAPGRTALLLLFLSTNMALIELFMNSPLQVLVFSHDITTRDVGKTAKQWQMRTW